MDNLASYIEHTLLKADAGKKGIENLCNEAREYKFAAVCINPYYVKLAREILKNSKIKIATVIGFPLGANFKEVKAYEAERVIEAGAEEIDMVLNVGALIDGDFNRVLEDIRAVVNVARGRALVKVILETCLLSNNQKKKACEIAMEAGADYVKTSTGFSTAGASIEDIKLMKSIVGDKLGIKASGGIRDYETAKKMIDAGASRIGASASINIIKRK